jgi:hypothetical protein
MYNYNKILKQKLKEAISLLVRLDNFVEDELPDWYSKSHLISEINDFYVKVENDKLISDCLTNEKS